jgi:hypothetical protein
MPFPHGVVGSGMAGLGTNLGSPWPPLPYAHAYMNRVSFINHSVLSLAEISRDHNSLSREAEFPIKQRVFNKESTTKGVHSGVPVKRISQQGCYQTPSAKQLRRNQFSM